MVAPRPLTPFSRQVVAAQGESVRDRHLPLARVAARGAGLDAQLPAAAARRPVARERADADTVGRRFLGWARFPTVRADTSSAGDVVVHLIDLRYADRPGAGFGSVTLPLGGADADQFDVIV